MLADLAQLTPGPAALTSLLARLGYQPRAYGTGLFAPGTNAGSLPVILVPLYQRAGLAVRKRELVGRHISRSATLAATLAALRSIDVRPSLLFLLERQAPPTGMAPEQILSLEGGVVPRIWRHCFGSFDALARITGKQSHPGLSNTAINAIEAAVPVLQALLHLKSDIKLRSATPWQSADAPLQPRLTVSAAHGGSRGSVLPTVFDILVSRRYDPIENVDHAIDEIRKAVAKAAPLALRTEVTMMEHEPPVPDPDASTRTREQRALVTGWGWPQVPFCSASTLVPGATVLGGLERPEYHPEGDDASTTLDDMAALSRTLRAFLRDA